MAGSGKKYYDPNIRWDYIGHSFDNGYRKNRTTGGWYNLNDLPKEQAYKYTRLPEPKNARVVCEYLTAYKECSLWNSGYFKHECCAYKCKFHCMNQQSVDTLINCDKCIESEKCTKRNSTVANDKRRNQALYCCYYKAKISEKQELLEKKGDPAAHIAMPILYQLSPQVQLCPVDHVLLQNRMIKLKRRFVKRCTDAKTGNICVPFCSKCNRLYIQKCIPQIRAKYFLSVQQLPTTSEARTTNPKSGNAIAPTVKQNLPVLALNVGQHVHGISDGDGTIISVSTANGKQVVKIQFASGIKSFDATYAFSKGALKIIG